MTFTSCHMYFRNPDCFNFSSSTFILFTEFVRFLCSYTLENQYYDSVCNVCLCECSSDVFMKKSAGFHLAKRHDSSMGFEAQLKILAVDESSSIAAFGQVVALSSLLPKIANNENSPNSPEMFRKHIAPIGLPVVFTDMLGMWSWDYVHSKWKCTAISGKATFQLKPQNLESISSNKFQYGVQIL